MVGTLVGRNTTTSHYVLSTPSYTSGPPSELTDKASSTYALTPPPPRNVRTQVAEAPMPTSGIKHHAGEAEGPPQCKHLVDNLSTPLIQDCLGRLVSVLSSCLTSSSSWRDFIHEHQGKLYLAPDLDNITHSAHDYLWKLRDHGIRVPVDDLPWSDVTIQCCADWGPHPSANLFQEFLQDEMADFIEAGFWVVLPLDQVRSLG